MKNWIRTVPGKAVCFVLCILCLGLTVLSVMGAAVLITGDFYTTPESYLRESALYALVRSEANDILYAAIDRDYEQPFLFSPENTNLRYKVVTPDGIAAESNLADPDGISASVWQYAFQEDWYSDDWHAVTAQRPQDGPGAEGHTLYIYLEDGLPVADKYAFCSSLITIAYALRYWIYPIAVTALVLCIACFCMLLSAAARRKHSDALHPGPLHRVPFDLLVFGVLTVLLLALAIGEEAFFYSGDIPVIVFLVFWLTACVCSALGLCVSLAARVKTRTLLKNTAVGKVCALAWKLAKKAGKLLLSLYRKAETLLRSLPLIWRTALIVAGLTFVDFIILATAYSDISVFFWLCKTVLLAGAALYAALFLRKLQAGGKALAEGDLTYQIDTSMMFWDFKEHGENLNSIAGGMSAAVEQRLRSERMKTELITNVSHDIKTPLTSIINYSTLIGETACDCEKHSEYAQVLVRKSQHLRRLLDDLVEASKASTGNLEVSLSPCDAGVLLTQAAGEFEQRCASAGLELVTAQPEKSVMILADSRRIWRVFENLMSNICKYSLSGTRVFLRLEEADQEAVFTFRNTSASVLDISPEALMERFVRGDSARSTEGSGLGLSIAQSLTQLQNGSLDISIDGDIFKVTLRFPLA